MYTGDREADLFLVQEGHSLLEKGYPEVLMATNDREIQESCADWGRRLHYCSSDQLVAELLRVPPALRCLIVYKDLPPRHDGLDVE